eukprot:8869302-Alexandrium_andersonii.AAC.1
MASQASSLVASRLWWTIARACPWRRHPAGVAADRGGGPEGNEELNDQMRKTRSAACAAALRRPPRGRGAAGLRLSP